MWIQQLGYKKGIKKREAKREKRKERSRRVKHKYLSQQSYFNQNKSDNQSL